MEVYDALDLKAGKRADYNRMGTLTQPVQFLPAAEKDSNWMAWNLDWLEWNGQKQLTRNARRLLKNYKLAEGIIDNTDYIIEDDSEYHDIVDALYNEPPDALELKFYPIIPNVINTLLGEFTKRTSVLTFHAVDEASHNEMFEQRSAMVEKALLAQAEQKLLANLLEQGQDLEDPEIQQILSQENLKTLPEIQEFFEKDYTSLIEEWAIHQKKVDEERFKLDELEERGFRDLLITDREFWHFNMREDDYDIDLWNPALTFYHKSPHIRYVSDSNYIGHMEMMTIADVLDKHGWLLNQEQLEELESIYPIKSVGYNISGLQNDGSFYDATKSHEWNTGNPSLAYRQFTSMRDNFTTSSADAVNWILGASEDFQDFDQSMLLRVTTCYWKTQKKVGHLTKIAESGEVIQEIIDETYEITEEPVYNTTFLKNKTKENLVYGEHVDWIWINESMGGIKIGPNQSMLYGQNNPSGINPIYIGINQNKPGRLKFQFKGDNSLYGCKLPVEGRIFSDRNVTSTSLVDNMKPFQIGYNIVNNQISDILVDELGSVVLLDQNALPQHSLGEDWGKNNFAKTWSVMKDFSMLPIDTTIQNTETPMNFQHFQQLDMSETSRLLGRVELANYFKQQAFEQVGVTQQRMGKEVEQSTATGVKVAIDTSYAQTEKYFVDHCDYLMPRVHKMRTDLAQWYQATKPSIRLQYITGESKRVDFQMNGTELLNRDLNVFCTTKRNHRNVMEHLKELAINNNTSGASLYDLGNIIKADTIDEVQNILKKSADNAMQQQSAERDSALQVEQMKQEQESKEQQLDRDHEARLAELERRKDVLVAEIRASGFGAMVDLNENQQSDFQDSMEDIRKSEAYSDQVASKREDQSFKKAQHSDNMNIKREEMALKRELKEADKEIARENKNQYDVKKNKDNKKS